jgi:YHS domain-containing protein
MKLAKLAAPVVLVLAALAAAAPAGALSPVNERMLGGVALDGYDPVAYFTVGKPVEGSKEHAAEWNGATWRFASAENRAKFLAAPERYAPQYGGYCAWAVAHGYTADTDPEAWTIVDGKLYLNYSVEVMAKWKLDVPGFIAQANRNWPKLLAGD